MKKMTCKQLGGVCDKELVAGTFEEMEGLIKDHASAMARSGDKSHMDAMEKMKQMQQSPAALKEWYADKKRMFDSLPDE